MSGREVELTEIARYDKLPCASCGSVDNLSVYEKEDEECVKHYDGICWGVCSADGGGFKSYKWLQDNGIIDELGAERMNVVKKNDIDHTSILEEIAGYESRGVRERKIKKKYAEMYGLKVSYDQESREIDTHYYPVTKGGEITGYTVRKLPKTFMTVGDVKDCQLQGQHLFEKGGEYYGKINHKFIIITEGFLDTLAAQQMLHENNSKYLTPVVSLPLGANLRAVTNNLKFLEKFENILLAFDQDEAGMENAKKCARIFEKGKCKIMSFSLKDPCEQLKADGTIGEAGINDTAKEFTRAFWDASEHKPSQVLTVDDIFERAMKLPEMGLSLPWPSATEKTLGIRRGEIHIIGAAPKIGKTEHQHQMIKHMTEVHGEIVGVMSLEENPVKTLKKVAGKYAGKQFTKPPEVGSYTLDEMHKAFTGLRGKVEFYSSEGVRDADEILKTVRYWASKGIWFFIIDPLTAIVAEHSSGEANDILNNFMSKAASMAMELQITFFMYSHVNPVKNGKPHDQGGDVLSSQFTGSRAMEKWAHYGWGIQRDRTQKDPALRNTARVTMLFDREFGEYCEYYAFYNNITNDWSECRNPEEEGEGFADYFNEAPPIDDFDPDPVEVKLEEEDEQEVDMADF